MDPGLRRDDEREGFHRNDGEQMDSRFRENDECGDCGDCGDFRPTNKAEAFAEMSGTKRRMMSAEAPPNQPLTAPKPPPQQPPPASPQAHSDKAPQDTRPTPPRTSRHAL